MAYQAVFKRYELKYLLTDAQLRHVLEAMEPYMQLDAYGDSVIRNLYFDTADYRLIRHSIEKPIYKEKLRIRSYHRAVENVPVYVELKKKYKHVVYKRRLQMPEEKALQWVQGGPAPESSQIAREIDYFRQFYPGLRPTVYLSYHRLAYYDKEGSSFRVTFDTKIRARQTGLSLNSSHADGALLLPEDMTLMELKCAGAMPLWMARTLSRHKIYKTSFSKYGTAYTKLIFPEIKEVLFHAEQPVQRSV